MDLTIDSADVVRLIQAHLTECGLHQSCDMLSTESGIRAAGASHALWKQWAVRGDWGTLLTHLNRIQIDKHRNLPHLLAEVYEMTILELAEQGNVALAHATLRFAADILNQSAKEKEDASRRKQKRGNKEEIPLSRQLEQRIAALVSLRGKNGAQKHQLPKGYYGPESITKEERRKDIGARLLATIPQIPKGRLLALVQQAIKWQSHTGQLSLISNQWNDEDDSNTGNDDEDTKNKKSKSRKRKRKAVPSSKFDLVLGEVNTNGNNQDSAKTTHFTSKSYSTLSFGKRATCRAALFAPDGSGLISASSDGLIEIWDPHERYKNLRMDLPYQQREELMGHDDNENNDATGGVVVAITAMAISNDATLLCSGDERGLVKVWKLETGQCLRQVQAHDRSSSISWIDMSPQGTHVLTASGETCREYGLRTMRMLKEFRGHTSFVNMCRYLLIGASTSSGSVDDMALRVLTCSADGTARIWDGQSLECLWALKPPSSKTLVGTSIVIHKGSDGASVGGGDGANLHTLLPLHTPPATLILVPRGKHAYMVTLNGVIRHIYSVDDATTTTFSPVIVAATTSPSNQWLYLVTQDGTCHIFRVMTGEAMATVSLVKKDAPNKDDKVPEISSIFHHPHTSMLGTFSTDKGQKRGTLTLWKMT